MCRLATQARNGQLRKLKTVFHQRRLDALHPDLVVLSESCALVGRFGEMLGIATTLFTRRMCIGDGRNQFLEVGIDAANCTDADRAGQFGFQVVDLEFVLLDMITELLRPDLGIALVTAFQQGHDDRTFESTGKVARVHALAHFFGELRQHFLGIQNANLSADLGKVVGLDIHQQL